MNKLNTTVAKLNKIQTVRQSGFTVVEVIIALIIIGILLLSAITIVSSTSTLNGRTSLRAEASELAFQKLQDYINTDYSNISIGDDVNSYEVEDFSTEVETVSGLSNVSAKVYVEPSSQVTSGSTETTVEFSARSEADSSSTDGSELVSKNGKTEDPGNCCRNDDDLTDNNYYNLVYNDRRPGSSNQQLPAIDLGSPKSVGFIRVNWYSSLYGSQNFRIEASNSVGSGWTAVASNLSTTGAGIFIGDYPQDIPVSGTYRYWRLYNVTGTDFNWIALSEFEAFTSSSGDVVEQGSGGSLDFTSDDIDLTESGGTQQTVGLRFKDIDVEQGLTIDNAYVQFTADENDTGVVNLRARGIDVDDASGWSGTSAVTSALASNSTSASTTWAPNSWTTGADGDAQKMNVTPIVQELINRVGWTSGNSMAFGVSHISGSSKRVARKSPAPELVIEWSETTTVSGGGIYTDDDMDGDADNPTLLKVTVQLEYDAYGQRLDSSYSTYIRQFGLGN